MTMSETRQNPATLHTFRQDHPILWPIEIRDYCMNPMSLSRNSEMPANNLSPNTAISLSSITNSGSMDSSKCLLGKFSGNEAVAPPTHVPMTETTHKEGCTVNVTKARASAAKEKEARVLRYREKKKNRKFEKKIRYASRKAFADKRPRIKGRFVKRNEVCDLPKYPSKLGMDRFHP
ncbi:hypothetical protein AMTRI_Chr13g83460 [Amborella trichopoda]|uniref:CCT domain-containing protein n=1 Tax=Amborella trichopoda TaxID=13333 RepID=W1NZL3_AMBTC|nr:zinc finger protein CONSTANS-LIKE 1-like [Amborella trichopoda]ERN00140.1 hypothetical protein AMTR_s00111p00022140 [Amborella trichopoda]|eukprot:XP_020519251.1 zinc finger protein CONSTANS-LIKE 1-like [Amborella trichopoda]